MGKETSDNRKKTTLIDFLYKDTNLISSFYSQLFGGDLTALQKAEISIDESNSAIDGNAAFIKGGVSSKQSNSQGLTQNINPYDSKVIELLETLNLKKILLSESDNGSIIAIEGKITYRNYDILSKIVPIISKMDLVPDFNKPLNPNAQGKAKKNTLGMVINNLISMLPYGLEFELQTSNHEFATCIIKQDSLTISPDDLFRSYGNNIPGTWTIVGIIDSSENRSATGKNTFKSGLDESTKAFADMFLNNDETIIRPIAIYRYLYV